MSFWGKFSKIRIFMGFSMSCLSTFNGDFQKRNIFSVFVPLLKAIRCFYSLKFSTFLCSWLLKQKQISCRKSPAKHKTFLLHERVSVMSTKKKKISLKTFCFVKRIKLSKQSSSEKLRKKIIHKMTKSIKMQNMFYKIVSFI